MLAQINEFIAMALKKKIPSIRIIYHHVCSKYLNYAMYYVSHQGSTNKTPYLEHLYMA